MKLVGVDWLPDVVPWSGADRRVALDQRDAVERNRELLGDQLRLRGGDALAELALAGVGGDAAVGGDGDPGIELPRHALILRGEGPLRERGVLEQRRGAAEADDQRAAALQEFAARRSITPSSRLRVRVAIAARASACA